MYHALVVALLATVAVCAPAIPPVMIAVSNQDATFNMSNINTNIVLVDFNSNATYVTTTLESNIQDGSAITLPFFAGGATYYEITNSVIGCLTYALEPTSSSPYATVSSNYDIFLWPLDDSDPKPYLLSRNGENNAFYPFFNTISDYDGTLYSFGINETEPTLYHWDLRSLDFANGEREFVQVATLWDIPGGETGSLGFPFFGVNTCFGSSGTLFYAANAATNMLFAVDVTTGDVSEMTINAPFNSTYNETELVALTHNDTSGTLYGLYLLNNPTTGQTVYAIGSIAGCSKTDCTFTVLIDFAFMGGTQSHPLSKFNVIPNSQYIVVVSANGESGPFSRINMNTFFVFDMQTLENVFFGPLDGVTGGGIEVVDFLM